MNHKEHIGAKYIFNFIAKTGIMLIFSSWLYVGFCAILNLRFEPSRPQVIVLVQVTVLFFVLKEFSGFLMQYKRNLKITFSIWSKFSWPMFFQSILVAAGTLSISLYLVRTPILSKGWMNLFFDKGGSILTSLIHIESFSIGYVIIAIIILILFIIIIPHFALLEELVFRKGKATLPQRITSSVVFGLVHMIMGIPLGASIALMFTGYFYSAVYSSSYRSHSSNMPEHYKSTPQPLLNSRAELLAMRESAVYHSMVNTILFGTIILLLIPLLFF